MKIKIEFVVKAPNQTERQQMFARMQAPEFTAEIPTGFYVQVIDNKSIVDNDQAKAFIEEERKRLMEAYNALFHFRLQ